MGALPIGYLDRLTVNPGLHYQKETPATSHLIKPQQCVVVNHSRNRKNRNHLEIWLSITVSLLCRK